MQDKLKIFLEKINLPKDMYKEFDEAKIVKIKLNREKTTAVFVIDINEPLPVNTITYIYNNIGKAFDNMPSVSVLFNAKNSPSTRLNEYFPFIIEKSSLRKPMKELFASKKVTTKENNLLIEVDNTVQKNIIDKQVDLIRKMYDQLGCKNVNIIININEEESKNIRKEIKKDSTPTLIIKNKKKNLTILGEETRGKVVELRDILIEESSVNVEAYIFSIVPFESSKTDFKILTLKISDNTDSIYAKFFSKNKAEFDRITKSLSNNTWYRFNGYIKHDKYANDLALNIRSIVEIPSKDIEVLDEAENKRVELHAHTQMSQMDGLTDVSKLIDCAIKWGHKAIAITDHNSCQSFPLAFKKAKDIKIIYGVELNVVDDEIDIVFREDDSVLADNTYVVFDTETTGFNAAGGDQMIEIGAVKIKNSKVIDTFSMLIDPKQKLPDKIVEITGITDAMLSGQESEEVVTKKFKDWIEDLPLVAHNAKFDQSFISMAYKKYGLSELNNTLIDTLELSRTLNTDWKRHGLSALVRRYEIEWDETSHHRADYDAIATSKIFIKMIKKLNALKIEKVSEIKNLVSKEDLHKQGNIFHVNLICTNKVGVKNLYRLISLSNTKYLHKTPRILRSEINKNREGILVGSSCYDGEVFNQARSKSNEELRNIMSFYDYIEIQPISHYDLLVQMSDFKNINEVKDNVFKIIKVADEANKLVVATGDVHHLHEKDKIYREIIINQNVPGGGRHVLSRKNITNIPSQHFMTTNEMLENFDYIGKEKAYEIVVTNTNKIADMVEDIKLIKSELRAPKLKGSAEITKKMVYETADKIYGNPLPKIVEDRIEAELKGIIDGGFDVIYLIAHKLVKKSNDEGYLVGSRGSVGSSFVATLMGITEVNPLEPHYICPNCKTSIFTENNELLAVNYSSGYDLPDKICECGTKFKKEGQDMPFATFLGFNADKVPDIDLNFSGDRQSASHDYTKELFGESHVFRAGTIGTVADKTAFGYVKGYLETKNLSKRNAEVERLALGCTGVKRTTGQHPGGIVVIPDYMDVLDFVPYQYPADDSASKWYTTHWDYHAIDEDLLKLDILGHDDPTMLKMLEDISGVDVMSIPFDDKEVMKVFQGPEVLGVTKEQIMCATGTQGLPELGTKFVKSMIEETKPTTFAELVKISGLSHGTDVWVGNAKNLIDKEIVEFKNVIGCRDDIMIYLIQCGLEPIDAFKIMEFVRKGLPSKLEDVWKKYEQIMRDKKVPEWYIDSCFKIKYMFPKAHATAYIMMALRVAWFKVHKPIHYYSAYFSVRCSDFDIETMIKGYDAIKRRLAELYNMKYDITNKDNSILGVLESALEFTARGFTFKNIDLYKSDAKNFIIDTDDMSLIPPFSSLDGLGGVAAYKIMEEREKRKFISIEDLQQRGKVSSTIIDRMTLMGILEGMPESSQLSLF